MICLGTTWYQLKEDMVAPLTANVYITSCSFKCYSMYVLSSL